MTAESTHFNVSKFNSNYPHLLQVSIKFPDFMTWTNYKNSDK